MTGKIMRIYTILSIVLITICSILRVVSALFFTDRDFGVYTRNSILPHLFDAFTLVSIVVLAILPLIFAKHFSRRHTNGLIKLTAFSTATLGFMFLAFALLTLLSMLSLNNFGTSDLLLTVAGVFASVYYLSLIFSRKSNAHSVAILSMVTIIWALVALIDVYFDMSILITSPNKMMHQLALLSLAVFGLAETRAALGFDNTRLYAPSAAISALLLASASLPNLLCPEIMLIGKSDRPIMYALELVAAFYTATRLYQFCIHGKEKE